MARKKKTAPFDPTEYLSIHDICLWESSLSRQEEFQASTHLGRCVPQSFHTSEPSLYRANFGDDEEELVLRVLVELGVRTVYKGTEEVPEDKTLYTLEATYCAEYVVHQVPSKEELSSFIEFNCIHNVWPFWRQHVLDILRQANLPTPMVPFFPGVPAKKRRKVASSNLLSDPAVAAEVDAKLARETGGEV
jgi:hypothetical protein